VRDSYARNIFCVLRNFKHFLFDLVAFEGVEGWNKFEGRGCLLHCTYTYSGFASGVS